MADILQIKLEVQNDGTVKASLADLGKTAKGTANELDKLADELQHVTDRANPAGASLRKLAADKEVLNRSLKQGLITGQQYNSTLALMDRQARATGAGGLKTLGGGLAALGLLTVVKDTYATNVEFQRMNGILVTLEGSQKGANARFKELQQIASETPAQLGEVITAYSALKARGLDPSREALLAYANVAASSGKTIQQFVEAVSDAATGEFERLKEFGIKARQNGDEVTLTFQGIATTIKNESSAIEGYLRRIGEVNFAGAAAQQMDTLGGTASNLGDSIQKLQVAFGNSGFNGTIKELTTDLGKVTSALADFLDEANRRQGDNGSAGTFLAALDAFSAQGWISGKAFDFLPNEAKIRASNAALSDTPTIVERIGDAYNVASSAVGRVYAEAHRQAEVATAKSAEETEKLLVKLREEEATYGLTKTAVLDYERTQALAKATTAEQRTEIEKLYTSLRGKVQAEESSGKATKANAAEVKRFVESLREEIAAHGKTEAQLLRDEAARIKSLTASVALRKAIDDETEARIRQITQDAAVAKSMVLYEETLDRAKDSIATLTVLQREQADALGGPVAQANARHKQALEEILAAEMALALQGKSTAQITAATATARAAAAELYSRDLKEAEKQARESAMATVEGFNSVMLDGIADLGPALRDGLTGGDWGDIGKSLAKSIVDGMIDTFLDENVVKPMQDAFMRSLNGGGGGSGGGMSSFFSSFSGGGQWGQFGSEQGWNAASANGPPSQLAGGGGPGIAGYANVAAGAYSVYDNYQNGPGGGEGALSGAAAGASAGSAFGPWGALIGGIIGGLAGLLGGAKDPDLRLGATGVTRKPEREFSTVFGSMQVGVRGGVDENDFIGLLTEFDQSIADLVVSVGGGADELDAIRERLSTWAVDLKGENVDSETVLSSRFNAVIEAIEPTWMQFLGQIDKVEDRIKAFAALYGIREQIVELDDLMASLDSDPLTRLRLELKALSDDVTETGEALAAAIESQDAVKIRDAAAAAQEAIVRRYETEIQLVRDLQSTLESAQAQARSTDLQLAQRIVATGGAGSIAIDAAAANMATTRGLVGSTSDPARALSFLSEFVGNVDSWLQASISNVQTLASVEAGRAQAALAANAAAREAITTMLADLSSERDRIVAAATERTQQQNEAIAARNQARQQLEDQRRQIETQALQEQLSIAQEFQRVVEQAKDMLAELTYSASNPLGGQARLALLTQDIDAAQARLGSSTGSDRAQQATELLDLLQQRLSMVQSEGLMQRPGGDYLALYNETLRQIANVQSIATPEANAALALQEELNRLQSETTEAVRSQTDNQVRYTSDERERLAEIKTEEERHQLELRVLANSDRALQQLLVDIQKDAEAEIAALNAEARAQYEWARGEAQRLETERAQAIVDQLTLITGGTPVDLFIAQRQAEATGLLTNIRDDLRNFLAAISGGVYTPVDSSGAPIPGVTPKPNIGDRPKGEDGSQVVLNVTVNASGDPTQIGRIVVDTINRNIPQIATQVRREITTA